jgi:hypothetical protein
VKKADLYRMCVYYALQIELWNNCQSCYGYGVFLDEEGFYSTCPAFYPVGELRNDGLYKLKHYTNKKARIKQPELPLRWKK